MTFVVRITLCIDLITDVLMIVVECVLEILDLAKRDGASTAKGTVRWSSRKVYMAAMRETPLTELYTTTNQVLEFHAVLLV